MYHNSKHSSDGALFCLTHLLLYHCDSVLKVAGDRLRSPVCIYETSMHEKYEVRRLISDAKF